MFIKLPLLSIWEKDILPVVRAAFGDTLTNLVVPPPRPAMQAVVDQQAEINDILPPVPRKGNLLDFSG
jgi:hypothetical protein